MQQGTSLIQHCKNPSGTKKLEKSNSYLVKKLDGGPGPGVGLAST